jgi:hypothetical protein
MVVIAIWATYLLAALAVSGAFVIAGRRSKTIVRLAAIREENGLPVDPLWSEAEPDLAADDSRCDVDAALRQALKRLAPIMANQSIHADVATSPGLLVRMPGAVLTDLLEEVLAATVKAAPSSRLLLTTSVRGDRVAISVTDDVPDADPDLRRAGFQALNERVVLRGATLDVEVRPHEGTTTTLRLANARETKDRALPETPRGAARPFVPISFGMSH